MKYKIHNTLQEKDIKFIFDTFIEVLDGKLGEDEANEIVQDRMEIFNKQLPVEYGLPISYWTDEKNEYTYEDFRSDILSRISNKVNEINFILDKDKDFIRGNNRHQNSGVSIDECIDWAVEDREELENHLESLSYKKHTCPIGELGMDVITLTKYINDKGNYECVVKIGDVIVGRTFENKLQKKTVFVSDPSLNKVMMKMINSVVFVKK